MTKADVIKAMQSITQIQFAQIGPGMVNNDTDDFATAITSAIERFGRDKPNTKYVHYTLPATAFRWQIAGSGSIAAFASWIAGYSYPLGVWLPYLATNQGAAPMDPNLYRVLEEPNGVVYLELLAGTGSAGQVLRVAFAVPHTIDDVSSTIPAPNEVAFKTLASAYLMRIASRKAAQNTGTTGLPNDIVDRRTQSGDLNARAKDLFAEYAELMGLSTGGSGESGSTSKGAHAFKDLDSGLWRGGLWHPATQR